jgi:hypothetical protein
MYGETLALYHVLLGSGVVTAKRAPDAAKDGQGRVAVKRGRRASETDHRFQK